jgi:hypothetical protein
VKRRKVALDANIPRRIVRMLQTGFGEQGYEFLHEPEFAPSNAEDEYWTTAFRRFGGEIIISGDKNITKRPYQITAFKDNNLICFFCEKKWSEHDHIFKAAHLVYWWPRIHAQLANCKAKDCWWVPMGIRPLDFREVRLPRHVIQTARQQKSI